jgi:transposase
MEASRFVFVDEMGTNTSLCPLYGWSRVGERLRVKAPKNWGKNVTLLSSMSTEGMGPSVAVEGATTRAVFEAYVEQALAPSLREGQIVVMDNLFRPQGRKGEGARRGARMRAYVSAVLVPDLNPIEEAFSKVKGLMRRAEARTREALVEAMDKALRAVSARDTRGFLEHSGYRASGQPF